MPDVHPGADPRRSSGVPEVKLEKLEVHGGTLLFRVSYGEQLDPLVNSGLLYVKYDFDAQDIPVSILSVPVLGFLAPLGWLTGARLRVGEIDDAYLRSLTQVEGEFRRMYPWLPAPGGVEGTPIKDLDSQDAAKYCVLYSGGVDSTCSLIRNMPKRPSALTVWGAPDLPLQNQSYWNRVHDRTSAFLKRLGVESRVVETNALGIVNQQAIRNKYRDRLRAGWWEELAFGLFYLSIAAPYTHRFDVGNVIIGSSNTSNDQVPWGSTPATDQKVKWGDVRVIHDSYDLGRDRKLREIVLPYADSVGGSVPLRVCIGKRSAISQSAGVNCGECAKCMMVEFTLLLSGHDASDFGFDVSPRSLSNLRRNLEEGHFGRSYDRTSWTYIKEKAKSPPEEIVARTPGLQEFLAWFARWDERPRGRLRVLDRVAPPGSRRRDMARAGFGKRHDDAK